MKKAKTLLITSLSFLALLISGCATTEPSSSASQSSTPSSTSSEDPTPVVNENVQVKMDTMLNKKKAAYDLTFKYDDHLFLEDAKTYNKELSELSFGNSVVITHKDRGEKFYEDCHYLDVEAHGYDAEPTENSLGYFIAHKRIEENEIYTLSFRGFDYKREWSNNFLLGLSGDHDGFLTRASEVYEVLKSYIAKYDQGRKIKLWINGYSRGGAIANVLSYLILSEGLIHVEQSDMFVYTFEAPKGLATDHAIKYQNVHNIVNKADFITYFAPEKFGLARCGTDYEIYNPNVSTIVKAFDEEITIADFVEIEVTTDEGTATISDDQHFTEFVLNTLTNSPCTDQTLTMNTRTEYVNNYQAMVRTILSLVFSLKPETQSEIMADIADKGMGGLLPLVLGGGKAIEEYLAPYFAKDGVTYDKEKLIGYLDKLITAVFSAYATLLTPVLGEGKTNYGRMLNMHYPEVTYALLLNSHK